jgi:hypothetical protein
MQWFPGSVKKLLRFAEEIWAEPACCSTPVAVQGRSRTDFKNAAMTNLQ